jgi:hypothetical protein
VIINVTGSDGNKTLTLPTASSTVGMILPIFALKTSGTNQVVIAVTGGSGDQIYYGNANALSVTIIPTTDARYGRFRMMVSMGNDVWTIMDDYLL